jgi:5-methylcytosine-specific restriction endonuclease McrA
VAHREQATEQRLKYKKTHPEADAERSRKYREAHRDQVTERKRIYSQTHPEMRQARSRQRRARKAGSGGTVTVEDINRLYRQQRGKCAFPGCKNKLKKRYHRDHAMPLYYHGPHTPENMQLLCQPCNLKKGKKHPDQVAAEVGLLFVWGSAALTLA